MANDVTRTFITEGGLTIHLKPVAGRLIALSHARLEEELRQAGVVVDPPTFEAEVFGGERERYPLTEEVLIAPDDPQETQRRQAAWKAYQNGLEKLEEERGKVVTNALLGLGTKFNMPESEEWIEEVQWATNGAPIPSHPVDRKVFFLLHYATTEAELQMLLSELQMLSAGLQPSESDVLSFRGGLRNKMERATRDAIRSVVEEDEEQGTVERDSRLPGSANDVSLADDA